MIFIPNFCWGYSDACTNPSKFTIDKRCYVTEEDKLTSPYNAVVGIGVPGSPFCTGTIIKYNDKLYIFTAKHCTDSNDDGEPDNTLRVALQNGASFDVNYKASGNYRIIPDENHGGDWAIYEIPDGNDIGSCFTEISDKEGEIKSQMYIASLIGYGWLKIMSDSDIKYFKDKYIEYLKSVKEEEADDYEFHYGLESDGGIITWFSYVEGFIDFCMIKDESYYNYIFGNGDLKVSKCNYYRGGSRKACQGWGGNSGGGVFDSVNELMAIHTRGNRNIGGKEHAGKDNDFCADCQIDLLNNSSSGALSKIKVALR